MNNFKIYKYILFSLASYGLYSLYVSGIIYLKKLVVMSTISYQIYSLYTITFPTVIGLVIGLPKLIKENKKDGPWRFDLFKFLVFGIPSCFLSYVQVLAQNLNINFLVVRPYIPLTITIFTFSILFGFTFISSFTKDELLEEKHFRS